jgi:hypothetical protein
MTPASGPRRSGWLLGGIVAAALALHASVLRAPFFADDYLFLEQVRGRSLGQALTSPDPIGNFLRPVGRPLYFWLVARLGGEEPAIFHGVNLALFLALVVVLFLLVRRLAGTGIAAFAGAFVAFHYAADVPLLWVSGSQDLLATLGAVSALYLHVRGHRAGAAAALGIGLLSKEHVFVAPVIAVLAGTPVDRAWWPAARRSWPLFAVTAIWAGVWLATAPGRPAAAAVMRSDVSAVPASLWHLVQVAAGLETGAVVVEGLAWGAVGLTLAVAALCAWLPAGPGSTVAAEADPSPATRMSPRRALGFGAAWAVLGAIPIAAVSSIWSAYFYLFALCGAGIALGSLVARWPAALRVAAILALGIGSWHARQIGEFATGLDAWSGQSHVNAFYIRRAMGTSERFLREMKAARPSLPPMSTVFFADLPPSVGLQTADGPVIRFAYHDASLRSYYLTEFSRDKARRGPVLFFAVENDTLRDHSDDPAMLASAAYSMMLGDKPAAAQSALELALVRTPGDHVLRYWLAWMQWAQGDTVSARRNLTRAGIRPAFGAIPELETAAHPRSPDDTTRAIAALLEARARAGLAHPIHARLAALCLPSARHRQLGVLEAFIYSRLRPQDPDAWRKWASAQLAEGRYDAAARSLERYFDLGGPAARQDAEAQQVMASLRRILPGGDVAQHAIRAPSRR